MFVREPFKAPKGAKIDYQVKYKGGRKPFPTEAQAKAFAKEQRQEGGWAQIDMVVTIEIEKRR